MIGGLPTKSLRKRQNHEISVRLAAAFTHGVGPGVNRATDTRTNSEAAAAKAIAIATEIELDYI